MRGGGPDAAILPPNPSASSPHARGWSPGGEVDLTTVAVFPACAGVVPSDKGHGHTIAESSPHARGWSHSQLNRGGGSSVFPACAEVVRALPSAGSWRGSLPRMRGGGPLSISRFTRSRWSSPHARGWSPAQRDRRRCRDVFPACAGVVRRRCQISTGLAGLPRMRGGGPCTPAPYLEAQQSSPHARGWSPDASSVYDQAHVFPACAGVVPHVQGPQCARERLPRMRGGGPLAALANPEELLSSPHARGWSPPIIRWHPRDLVFPACAGVVPGR